MSIIILALVLLMGLGLLIAVTVYLYKCGENFQARNNTDLQKASKYLHWAKFTTIMDMVILLILIILLFFTGPGAIKLVMLAGSGLTAVALIASGALAAVTADYIKKSGTNSHAAWLDAFIASAFTWGTLALVVVCFFIFLFIKHEEKIKKEKRDIDTIIELQEMGAENIRVKVD